MTQGRRDHPRSKQRHRRVVHQNSVSILALFLLLSLSAVAHSHQAFGRYPVLYQQFTQQPHDAGNRASDEKDVRVLEPGKPIKRDLADGQRDVYQIRLGADQFLKALVEQQGIDVAVQVLGPDGKHIFEFSSESRPRGQESVLLVAEAAGDYRLNVRPTQMGTAAGGYEIRIEELRDATERDRALQEARKLYEEYGKLRQAGKYDEALPLVERALGIRERLLGQDHLDVAAATNGLAILYKEKGEYAKAELLYQRSLAVREKTLGPEHPDVADSLHNLAIIHWNKGDYVKAEQLFQRALSIRERTLGPEHLDFASSLNNLAGLYLDKGDRVQAESLLQRVLSIREKALGPEHLHVAASLNNLSLAYSDKGDYARAELLLQRSLTIKEKALGLEHPDVAVSLNNLAVIYFEKGDYAKAEPLYGRALSIRKKALGPDHPDVAQSIYNLGFLYWSRGEYAKAEPLYGRALAIREKTLGPEHPDVADSLNNLGFLYGSKGEYTKAEPLFLRAREIWEKAHGSEHPRVAMPLNNLAQLYQYRGDYENAESFYQRALAIEEKALGPEHPKVANTLNSLAVLYAAKRDMAQAVIFQSRANTVSEHNLRLNLATGSERQKLAYLAILSAQTDRTISLHLRYASGDTMMLSLAATLILQRKGRALDVTSGNLNALRNRFNTEDQAFLDQLTETRSELARLVLGGPQRMTAEQYRDRIKELEDQAEKLEADISRRSSEFRAQSLPVTLAAVQAAVPSDAALIEFASYRPFNARATKDDQAYGHPRYVAYVLRRQGEIQWKELGEVKIIDKTITALREALRDPKRKDVKSLARALDQKVFQPLRPLIGETTQLLISPDGNLNLIPFAALVDERGRYLVERYSISYLASGRDLLRLQVARESRSGPLVIAAPDFGGRSRVLAARRWEGKKDAPKGKLNEQVKEESAASAFSQLYFTPLPYTAQEGDALRALLPGATLLTKRQASKAALSQVRGPTLLHIATHGFFLKDLKLTPAGERGLQAVNDDPQRLLRGMERNGIRIENPLLRSGLALAGANERKPDDNGILTALEMTGLNLWGTKLVVLSACDTGVGEVKNGDGVHGLRRALVLAGAETQVMTLWAVSDKATRELMVAYYRLLQQGQGRGEALRQVQLEMLKKVNRRHPYYWASFIQSGEWANLEINEPDK